MVVLYQVEVSLIFYEGLDISVVIVVVEVFFEVYIMMYYCLGYDIMFFGFFVVLY